MPKFFKGILVLQGLLLIVLQSTLWWGDRSLKTIWAAQQRIEDMQSQNVARFDRNGKLHSEILALKSHDSVALEEKARLVLGMVKPDESFFVVVDSP